MKLNIGCGRMVLDGWTNCDIQVSPHAPREPEILCDAKEIPLEDGCADEVMALHLIEHFYLWEVPDVLNEWRRLLKDGGKLILELPNLELACIAVLEGKSHSKSMWPLYGDPGHCDEHMCHRWGYTPETIEVLLRHFGFGEIQHLPPQTHGAQEDRDMRVEAIKLETAA